MRPAIFAALVFALGSAGTGGALAQSNPRIGAAAIIDKEVSGALGDSRRVLKRGDGVFQNETIATGAASKAQLLFNDETALSMGPDSKVVLDKLVYDPDKKAGEVSLRAVSGAFRFVSGSAPKGAYSIKTPAGTIGVRGTIIEFNVVGSVVTLTLFEGATTFCVSVGQCTELNKPGTYIVVTGNQFTATQVLNALGCGGSKCNDTSYKQGDQTTYITFFTDNKTNPIPPAGENAFQVQLRQYVQHLLAQVTAHLERHANSEHHQLSSWRLHKVNLKIAALNKKVDEDLIPGLDTKWELWRAKWVVRRDVHRINDFIDGRRHRRHHHGYHAHTSHHGYHHHRWRRHHRRHRHHHHGGD